MNLSTVPVSPHVLGFIRVACEDDPLFGEARTRNEFLITQRHHANASPQAKRAPHPLQEQLGSAAEGVEEGAARKLTPLKAIDIWALRVRLHARTQPRLQSRAF